jgi:orotidine-5'-phosphate decarboxylase
MTPSPPPTKQNTQSLSAKDIPVGERLIVALDTENVAQARDLVIALGDTVSFYKLGLSLIFDAGYWQLFDWLTASGKKAFADIKLFDIPETVEASVSKLVGRGASFVTIHAHEKMIRAAVKGRRDETNLKILAVTVLTSLDAGDLRDMGFPPVDVRHLVLDRARRMLDAGCDGVVSSGLEISSLRGEYGDNFLIVVPGIRPVENALDARDDQKRVVDVETAFNNGADYVVVGRPIRATPDPRAAAASFQERIAKVFDRR